MATKREVGILLSDADYKRRYPDAIDASDLFNSLGDVLRLPSRIPALNDMLGGGLPYGTIYETYGEESTGKSLLATDFAAVTHALGGVVLYNDAEGTYDPFWASRNGMIMKKGLTNLYPENIIENISDWFADTIVKTRAKLLNNQPLLIIVDSTAALDTLDNINSSQADSKAEMGNRAKAIYTFLRRRNKLLKKYGAIAIFINQLRQKVGASKFEDPDTTPGGSAMKFFASIRTGLYRGKSIKDEYDEVVGQNVYVRVKKNKTAPPKKRVQLRVYFTEHEGKIGYDKYAGLRECLMDKKILKRKTARYYYKGEQLAHGDSKMDMLLETNHELRKKLLKKAKINTISVLRDKLDSIKTNLYPVSLKKKKDKSDGEE